MAHFGDLSELPLRVKVVRSRTKKKGGVQPWSLQFIMVKTSRFHFLDNCLPPFAFTLWTLWPSGAVHSQTIIFDGEEVEVLMGSR